MQRVAIEPVPVNPDEAHIVAISVKGWQIVASGSDRTTMTSPSLETERLTIVLPTGDLAEATARYYADNWEHLLPWSPPMTRELLSADYWAHKHEASLADARNGTAFRFVLLEKQREADDIVGTIGLSQIARGPFSACYLGYSLAERAQGKGLMTEALRATIAFAFADLRLHRVMANYLPTNERSGRVLRRLGFQVEGYARDYLFIHGVWADHILTSLTNTAMLTPQG